MRGLVMVRIVVLATTRGVVSVAYMRGVVMVRIVVLANTRGVVSVAYMRGLLSCDER